MLVYTTIRVTTLAGTETRIFDTEAMISDNNCHRPLKTLFRYFEQKYSREDRCRSRHDMKPFLARAERILERTDDSTWLTWNKRQRSHNLPRSFALSNLQTVHRRFNRLMFEADGVRFTDGVARRNLLVIMRIIQSGSDRRVSIFESQEGAPIN